MAETDAEPAREWRCFHCDELFTDFDAAADHFGKYERDCEPICTVGAKRFREMEDELAMWRNESDSSSRAFYELGAKHTQELMRNEERGYERGLRDARHEEIWRWYLAAPTVERLKRALAWSIATVETVALQLPVGSTKRVMLQRENQRAREIAGISVDPPLALRRAGWTP